MRWALNFARSKSRALLLFVVTIVGEAHFLTKLTTSPDAFLLSAFDLDPNIHFQLFAYLQALSLLVLLLAFMDRFFVAAVASTLLLRTFVNFTDLAGRAQFVWLAVGLCVALILEKIVERYDLRRKISDLPVSMLLVSVYGFGSLHKFSNYENSRRYIVSQFSNRSELLNVLCSGSSNCIPIVAISWLGPVIDATLAMLTIRRDCLRFRLLLSLVYHYFIALAVPFLPISIPMLSIHYYLARQQSPEIAKDVLKNRNRWLWIFAVATLVFLEIYFVAVGNDVLARATLVTLVLLPFLFLFLPFVRHDVKPEAERLRIKSEFQFIVSSRKVRNSFLLFILVFSLFGISPALLNIPNSQMSLGWTMLSAKTKHQFKLVLPDDKCFRVYWSSRFTHLITRKGSDGNLEYWASDPDFFLRLERYLREKKKCWPAAKKLEWTTGVDPINPW